MMAVPFVLLDLSECHRFPESQSLATPRVFVAFRVVLASSSHVDALHS